MHDSTHDGISFTTNSSFCAHLSPFLCCLMEASFPVKLRACSLTRLFALPSNWKKAQKGCLSKMNQPGQTSRLCHHAGISRYMFSKGNPRNSPSGEFWINTGSGFTVMRRPVTLQGSAALLLVGGIWWNRCQENINIWSRKAATNSNMKRNEMFTPLTHNALMPCRIRT